MTQVSYTLCKKCNNKAHVVEMLRLLDAGHECLDQTACEGRQRKRRIKKYQIV